MFIHKPILLDPVLTFLAGQQEEVLLVDATLGEGGHAEAFLSSNPRLVLVGIERDRQIIDRARERLDRFGRRARLFRMDFLEFFSSVAELVDRSPQCIFFDLGVSMFHYQASGRGFSFRRSEPLDMRLDSEKDETAAQLIATSSEEELKSLIRRFGEERFAAAISAAIVAERKKGAIEDSQALARIVWNAVPPAYRHGRIHPATRTFQALRIAVNGELDLLEATLPLAFDSLSVGGRMGVISFHSLEDRIVKRFFQERNKSCTCPSESPICQCGGQRRARILTRKPIFAAEAEIRANPASRSARFRILEKIV
ncbi:MAG: 16S rRNA (cytosine(1402)-N(4))-methyltransferase RsmH [Spirochaetaceae bacterium]|nr:MAG: 16S rRNA (cytosine(1402)-N(4))-methyltransferase RsmH [Spirochaetaceae bacterium]